MTNKILLAAIALGLWADAAVNFVRPVQAQGSVADLAIEWSGMSRKLDGVSTRVEDIQTDMVRLLVETLKRTRCSAD